MASKLVRLSLITNTNRIFARIANEWSIIIYLLILVNVVPISEAISNCTLNGIRYLCSNIATTTDFPLVLTANVRKVTLIGTNELSHSFPDERFTHHTWSKVSELSILVFTNVDSIERMFLNGLEELKFLSVSSCTDIHTIDKDTFSFTPNIEELHFDGDTRLHLYVVEAALTDKLSNLRFLSLIAIQGSENHVVLGKNFSNALLGKILTALDISRVNVIYVEHAITQDVFGNLKYLNVSYSTILLPRKLNDISRGLAPNIELLDITGVRYLLLNSMIEGEYQIEECFLDLKPMYFFLQGIFEPDIQVNLDVIVRSDNCYTEVPKMLDFSKNSLARLNITFLGNSSAHELETLNLEGNKMEYISPHLLSICRSLKNLDLSNNLLMKMQNMDDFTNMFTENKDLEIIFLRNNRLTFVPSNLFVSNSKLRIIDLSENELIYFNLYLYFVENLALINLRMNRLKDLSASMMEQFDSLLWKQNSESNQRTNVTNVLLKHFQDKSLIGKRYRYGYNASEDIQFEELHSMIPLYVTIDILDNRFVCDCDTLVFMEWILFTKIDIINKTVLSCKYGNNDEYLSIELLQTVQTNCRLAVRIGFGVASSAAIIVSILTFVIMFHRRCKSDRRNQDLQNLKKEILQENTHFEFLMFLSYCSRDTQIVEEQILPSLKRYLHETFNTARDIVCTGADDFVPGMRIIDEIHRCINKSLVVVPVITPAFLQSKWSQEECVAAVDRHRQVVILMEKNTDTSSAIVTIQNLIWQHTRGTWSDNEGVFVIRPSWNIICEGIIRAASEALRHYRRHNLIEPAEDNPLVEEMV
ncbi:hypothetical protein ACJMK2_000663 [Sinanodonta woodiana]|uniref:TIR domain-containing protein n=1 Tax=Sinanodonta woodiana TaxID=1069815 RepID=A0ABD3XT90_SINWO